MVLAVADFLPHASSMNEAATIRRVTNNGRDVLLLEGDWRLVGLGTISSQLDIEAGHMAIDIANVSAMDTVGAWVIHRHAIAQGVGIDGVTDKFRVLLSQVSAADNAVQTYRPRINPVLRVLGEIGDATVVAGRTFVGLIGFFGSVLVALMAIFRNSRSLRVNSFVQHFEAVGIKALGIIGLMSFLIGIVIAQQGAVQLRQFGAEVYTINLIGRLTARELGVLMTAIMVAGRSGSAFAAQIGTMKLTEEVDAMRTIGISPIGALVVPRITASVLMMPLLAFYATLLAMLGGGIFCWISLGIPPVTFIERLREVTPVTDMYIGLIKSIVFGLIIGLAGCFQGLQVEKDAEEVGARTTAAVVQAIFIVIVLDAFFAVFFEKVGWG